MPNRTLLQKIGFKPKENTSGIFHQKYSACEGYCIEVDFDKEKFDYGELILSDSKTTLNFSQAENWVVLECVDRLLKKGYKPQNIQLEKVYPAGHGHSGRLDICVTRDDGSEYLLIECKTYGKEYENAVKKLTKDGGQLFTYFKFSNKADVIMLYSSEFKGGGIHYKNEIVKIEDDYRTGDVKDFYEKWSKLTKDNGVFENWVNPYNFESKALTINDLEEIRQEDSSFIFNRFLEILRHNVVSDKGNAFNRIFTLFLCKIYDEKINEGTDNELDFQWREGVDDHRSFQIRLTDLYKNGMHEFLEKVVTDFSETEFNNKFKHLDDRLRNSILDEFQKLRLEKNNEFAIKDVYDEQSFNENAVVVKEIVQLLEKFRLRYTKKQQYLSDFFELLLTTGLKQESGQFFTPVPVAQFIIKSLPIDTILEHKLSNSKIDNDTLLPYVMDYAAGSGHFLTETMHEMQRLIKQKDNAKYHPSVAKKIRNWQDDHFAWAMQYVYGIEKDYRLVKVGKVGCYLHGDGLANVIHSDGLARFNHPDYKGKLLLTDKDCKQDNKQFDILVSNPPYSVSAFKNSARTFYKDEDFELYNRLTDSSSEIECLFIERTKQLLKDGAVAGIILPSSILSNGGIYAKARELILQYFEIIGIAELGSNTFMATGTNTVTLFLRRRNNYDSINIKKAIEKFFTTLLDVTINSIEKPVAKYVDNVWVGIFYEDYQTLLQKTPNQKILEHDIYKEYKSKIKSKDADAFWNQVLEKEADKLFYYILVYNQKLVLVKSGEKDSEKRFLGYEFSTRRGSEGIHPIQRGKSIEECTQLFDPEIFDNPEKASTYIYKAFHGDFDFPIDASMQNNVTRHSVVDMLTFNRVDFEKNISLSIKKKVDIGSKWEIVSIGQIANTQYGYTDKATDNGEIRYLRITDLNDDGTIDLNNIPKFISPDEEAKKQFLLENNDIVIARSGSVGKSAIYKSELYERMIFASYLIRIKVNEAKILPQFLFLFTKTEMYWSQVKMYSTAVTQPNLNAEKIKEFKIPLPPKDIQQKIIQEVEKVEFDGFVLYKKIKELETETFKKFENTKFEEEYLGNITSFKNGLNYSRTSKGEIIDIVGVKDFQDRFSPDLYSLEKIQIDGDLNEEYELKKNDILVVRSNGSANLVGRFLYIENVLAKTSYSGFTIRIRVDSSKVDAKYLCYYLKSDRVRKALTSDSKGSNIKSLNQNILSSLNIPLPTLLEQRRVIEDIEIIEGEIESLKKEMELIPKKRASILEKYL